MRHNGRALNLLWTGFVRQCHDIRHKSGAAPFIRWLSGVPVVSPNKWATKERADAMDKQDLNDQEESHSDERRHDKDVTVTVRTPAGASHTFEFKRNERVDKVTRQAVMHFVAGGQLAAGEFGMALVRNSVATPMNDAGRLDDYHVVDGDVLHLVNKAPQVDG